MGLSTDEKAQLCYVCLFGDPAKPGDPNSLTAVVHMLNYKFTALLWVLGVIATALSTEAIASLFKVTQ